RITGLAEMKLPVEPCEIRVFESAEKVQPFLGGPAAGFNGLPLPPAGDLLLDAGKRVRVRFRGGGGDARPVDPLIDRYRCRKLAVQVIEEILRSDALEREVVEVGAEKSIEARAAGFALDGAQQ